MTRREGRVRAKRTRHAKVGGGEADSESESDLDVMEDSGPGQSTPFVRVDTPRVPGKLTHGDEGSVPLSPSSRRGDFGGGEGSPTNSSSSSNSGGGEDSSHCTNSICDALDGDDGSDGKSNSESSRSASSDVDSAGGAGSYGTGEPGEHSVISCDPDEMEDELAEFKFDSDDGRYPFRLHAGRTRSQTRQLQTIEEEPDDGGAQGSEEALLSTVLETEKGQEVVANYLCDSLVKDSYEEEQARRARMNEPYRHEIEGMLQPNNPEQQAFGAVVGDNGSPQQQIDPKPSDVEDLPFTYKDM
eukprot:g15578.t1